jgi:hypothetical protein
VTADRTVDAFTVARRAEDVSWTWVEDQVLTLHARSRDVHVLNHTAAALFAALDGHTRLADIANGLAGTAEPSPEALGHCVVGLGQLRAQGLVGDPEPSRGPASPIEPVADLTTQTTTAAIAGHQRLGPFAALRHRFVIDSLIDIPSLQDLLAALRTDRRPLGAYRISATEHGFTLLWDGIAVGSATTVSELPDLLMASVNRLAVASLSRLTAIHAAVVAGPNGAVLLAGPSGVGKSTLATRLVRAGFEYLGDEVAAIANGQAVVWSYPKPVSLRRDVGVTLIGPAGWAPASTSRLVGPATIGATNSQAAPLLATLVLERGPGPACKLERLAPIDAAARLLANTFPGPHAGRGLAAVAHVSLDFPAFRLTFDGSAPDDVTATVSEVLRSR